MFEQLGEKINQVFTKLGGFGKLNEKNISEAIREIRMALLEADVHVAVVRTLIEKVKERALGQELYESLSPQQLFFQIVHQELLAVFAEQNFTLQGKKPHVILMVGLQGSGKTTSSAKLAAYYKKSGRKVYLIPADVTRPAAIKQLQILAKEIEVDVYPTPEKADAVKVSQQGLKEALVLGADVVIIDTAGRLQIDEELMKELQKIQKKLPDPQILFVVDAMMGQEAVRVSKTFHDLLSIDGLILTKLDGDAKGGAILSIQQVTQAPVAFTGVGEKIKDFEVFDPQRLVSRLLDRGDILSLVEKAQEVINEEEAKSLEKKIKRNDFDLEDFRKQLQQMKKLGSLKGVMGMLPGARALSKQVNMDEAEKELRRKEAIINSMTLKERTRPEILNGRRRLRIAQGSGTQVSEVNRLVKEFAEMKKMLKKFNKGGMRGVRSLLGM